MKKIISFLLLALFLVPCFSQSILDPEVLNKVQASVFEVVTNKAEEGSIEYEKPLPFSRLPFSIRNDKYNEFVYNKLDRIRRNYQLKCIIRYLYNYWFNNYRNAKINCRS